MKKITTSQLILSIVDLDTRSLEVQRSSADIYVTGASHETDAFFFCDSGSYDEVRGEGADRVEGPVGRRGHGAGQHATPHARRESALVEPAHGQVQTFLAGPLYGPTDFEELGIPLSPGRAKLLMRGFLGRMRVKRGHAAVQEAHPEGHHSAIARDTE